MKQIIPKVTIEGREVDFIRVNYAQPGILSAATLQFTIPLTVAGTESLWNKEVTFYVSKSDSKPIFRGWINRTKKDFNKVNIFAEDAFGYMLKGGDTTLAEVVLDDRENVDGLTDGAAIIKLLQMSELTHGMNVVNYQINKLIHETHTFILWHYIRGSVYDTPFWREAQTKTTTIFKQPNENFKNMVNFAKSIDYMSCRSIPKDAKGKDIEYGQWPPNSIKLWYDEYIDNKEIEEDSKQHE